jgi:L,D-transpeptidase YcbB
MQRYEDSSWDVGSLAMCPLNARSRPGLALLLMAASILCGGPAFAQAHKRAPATSAQKLEGAAARLSAIVASGHLADLRWPNFSNYRSQVTSFYKPFTY